MTDLIERSKAIDADGWQITPAGLRAIAEELRLVGHPLMANVIDGAADEIEQLRALPAASVTDEMTANAVRAYVGAGKRGVIDLHEAIRAAIEAAIGHGK